MLTLVGRSDRAELIVSTGPSVRSANHEGTWAANQDRDGKHPNPAGSYLAACVFYAMLTDPDPSTTTFTADLEPAEAQFLQRPATDVVSAGGVSLASVE